MLIIMNILCICLVLSKMCKKLFIYSLALAYTQSIECYSAGGLRLLLITEPQAITVTCLELALIMTLTILEF